MKKLAFVLPVLVIIAAIVFFAVHRRSTLRHVNDEIKEAAATHFSFADQLAMARSACGDGEVDVNNKKEIHCSSCPPASDFAGAAAIPGGNRGWTLDGAIPGSFSAKDAEEALLHASGCESHAKNYGGNFLMRRSGDDWSTVRYASGGTANEKCQKVPWPGGREALVCENTDMHAGIVSDALQLLLFDAAAPPNADFANSVFLALTDESGNCGFEKSLNAKPHMIQLAKINGFEVMPEAADGNRNVTVDATITRVTSSSKPGSTCPAGKPHIYHVVFDNQGDHFDAGEGYVVMDALKREDCCALTVTPRVVPGRY